MEKFGKIKTQSDNFTLNLTGLFEYLTREDREILKNAAYGRYSFSENLYELIRSYKIRKMMDNMKLRRYIEISKLSASEFLCIEILRTFPDVKWNWTEVSKNYAIPCFDIMQNRDLPWNIEELIHRDDFSEEMLKEFNVNQSKNGGPTLVDYQMSGVQCLDLDVKLEDAMKTLSEKYPEVFNNISVKKLLKIRKNVRKNIRENIRRNDNILNCLEPFEEPNEQIKPEKYGDSYISTRRQYVQMLLYNPEDLIFPEESRFFKCEDVLKFPEIFASEERLIPNVKQNLLKRNLLTIELMGELPFKWTEYDLISMASCTSIPIDEMAIIIKSYFTLPFIEVNKYPNQVRASDKFIGKLMRILVLREDFDPEKYEMYSKYFKDFLPDHEAKKYELIPDRNEIDFDDLFQFLVQNFVEINEAALACYFLIKRLNSNFALKIYNLLFDKIKDKEINYSQYFQIEGKLSFMFDSEIFKQLYWLFDDSEIEKSGTIHYMMLPIFRKELEFK